MELKKKLTESIKAILALPHLLLWDGTSTVIRLLDLEKTIERIAYCYSNPANAHLTDTIENYPGLSSWSEYLACPDEIGSSYQSKEKWIRYSSMKPIETLTAEQYLRMLNTFDSIDHPLILEPNAWMLVFGITELHEVQAVNHQIVALIRENEQLARNQRQENNKTVWSRRELRSQTPTISGHIPKKRERKIFFLGSTKEIRLEFYTGYVQFVKTCRGLYDLWRKGDFTIQWPPQAFIPWRPPLATG
jgi:cell division protein FtsB